MAIQSRQLEPGPDATRLNIYIKLKMPLPPWLTCWLAKFMFRRFKVEQQFETMVRMIAEEMARDEANGTVFGE